MGNIPIQISMIYTGTRLKVTFKLDETMSNENARVLRLPIKQESSAIQTRDAMTTNGYLSMEYYK